jgi:hypothetical protein
MASFAQHRHFAGVGSIALALCTLPACKAKEELLAPASHSAAEQNGALVSAGGAGSAALPPAPGAPGERPSLQQNMGRGFQGKLALRVQNSTGAPYDLRYLSLGNTARLQIDSDEQTRPAAAPLHLDALIWGESISLLDHQRRSIRTIPLQQIRPSEQPASTVETKKTGERTSILGVFCETYELRDGPLRVDACVGGLPGDFDVGKFESVSGVDIPAWAEELLRQELLPLRAVARDASGRELYRLELVEYSSGPVDRELLAVPANYQPAAANSPASNSKPAASRAMPVGSAPGGQP